MKKYIYDEIAIKAVMNILNSLKVEGINQAQNLVKMAAILSAGKSKNKPVGKNYFRSHGREKTLWSTRTS